jgi:hypothetical protein
MTKKFFFMAVMTANLEGRPQASFNTVTSINGRNITAAVLEMIQNGGGQMCQQQGVNFDDIVIQNIFFLGEMTQEEFVKNTMLDPEFRNAQLQAMADQANMAQAANEASDLGAQADETAGAEEALAVSDDVSADVQLEPANPVLEPKLGLAVDNTKGEVEAPTADVSEEARDQAYQESGTAVGDIGRSNDLSELDAQAVEEIPVDDVTTADVKPSE